jgi:hypothetical protein
MPKTVVRSKQIKDADLLQEDMSTTIPCSKKANYVAVAAPGVTDDSDAGYAIGSDWFDITADKAYVCLDNTNGAAVWKETTQAGGVGGGVTVFSFLS